MFILPTRQKLGYRFGEPTFYSSFHKGQDYAAYDDPVKAPTDCYVDTFSDVGGGYWMQFHYKDVKIQIAHLSKYIKKGNVKEGELVAITGNSGKYTSGPHAHISVYKNGKLIDPELFNWEEGAAMNAEEKKQMWETMAKNRDAIKKESKELRAMIRGIWDTNKSQEDKIKNLQGHKHNLDGFTVEQEEALGLLTRIINFFKKG